MVFSFEADVFGEEEEDGDTAVEVIALDAEVVGECTV